MKHPFKSSSNDRHHWCRWQTLDPAASGTRLQLKLGWNLLGHGQRNLFNHRRYRNQPTYHSWRWRWGNDSFAIMHFLSSKFNSTISFPSTIKIRVRLQSMPVLQLAGASVCLPWKFIMQHTASPDVEENERKEILWFDVDAIVWGTGLLCTMYCWTSTCPFFFCAIENISSASRIHLGFFDFDQEPHSKWLCLVYRIVIESDEMEVCYAIPTSASSISLWIT